MRVLLGFLFAAVFSLAQPGFHALFNGKNLDEFIVDTPDVWRVENGVIIGESAAGLKWNDFLRTRESYSNFQLKLSFRLKDGIGNSGIQFRSRPVPDSHEVSGYQADIGQQYWGCLYDESRRKRVLVEAPQDKLAGLRKDGWNEYVITARDNHITLDLNGVRTVDYRESEPGIETTGFLALQVHSGPPTKVEFKDLVIRELGGR